MIHVSPRRWYLIFNTLFALGFLVCRSNYPLHAVDNSPFSFLRSTLCFLLPVLFSSPLVFISQLSLFFEESIVPLNVVVVGAGTSFICWSGLMHCALVNLAIHGQVCNIAYLAWSVVQLSTLFQFSVVHAWLLDQMAYTSSAFVIKYAVVEIKITFHANFLLCNGDRISGHLIRQLQGLYAGAKIPCHP